MKRKFWKNGEDNEGRVNIIFIGEPTIGYCRKIIVYGKGSGQVRQLMFSTFHKPIKGNRFMGMILKDPGERRI